jgi:hypothetical protein
VHVQTLALGGVVFCNAFTVAESRNVDLLRRFCRAMIQQKLLKRDQKFHKELCNNFWLEAPFSVG